jgi:hypothetical protein
MSNQSSITVNQDGVNSFAVALWNPPQYEIFIDDQKKRLESSKQRRRRARRLRAKRYDTR